MVFSGIAKCPYCGKEFIDSFDDHGGELSFYDDDLEPTDVDLEPKVLHCGKCHRDFVWHGRLLLETTASAIVGQAEQSE